MHRVSHSIKTAIDDYSDTYSIIGNSSSTLHGHICDRICENPAKRGIFSFLIYSTSRLHGALGCLPPNLEAVAQAVFALRTTTLQYFC